MPVRPLPEAFHTSAGIEGLDAASCRWKARTQVAIENDCVDLTPFVREDILLEFPQHPLCKPDCGGLKTSQTWQGPKNRRQG